MDDDTHVAPQDRALNNSQIASGPAVDSTLPASSGDGSCYWNDKKYSDGATVCDAHQRYKCWSGKWVDIGNC